MSGDTEIFRTVARIGNGLEQRFFGECAFVERDGHGVGHQADRAGLHARQSGYCFFHRSLTSRAGHSGDCEFFVCHKTSFFG